MLSDYYCFFTPEKLAEKLLTLITQENVKCIIDISCGNGALLKAGVHRYPEAELLGVDIVDYNLQGEINNCTFHLSDGFEYAKKSKVKYDLILANPPFGRCGHEYRKTVKRNELNRNRLECIMLDANLSLMHDNSWLIVILPETLVTGQSYKNVRKMIGQNYGIEYIVYLPRDTFGSHLISTYAVVITGTKQEKDTSVLSANRIETDWELKPKGNIPHSEMIDGRWINSKEYIPKTTVDIIRGSICSADFVKTGKPVFHNSKKDYNPWKPSIRYIDNERSVTKTAYLGDIIINRVGHSVGYWWENNEVERPITDCVFALRAFPGLRKIMEDLSVDGRLNIPIRGVATQYITQQDIVELIDEFRNSSEE